MKNVGITGQTGFIGRNLFNFLNLKKDKVNLINFKDEYFDNESELENFVSNCDVIVHLAALNRHNDANEIVKINIELVKKLIITTEKIKKFPHIIFSSSTQEEKDNPYGESKLEGRKLFEDWSKRNNSKFTGLIIPNVFGQGGMPFYNSVISTFSYQLTHNDNPQIQIDNNLKLIYVGNLIKNIYDIIKNERTENSYRISEDATYKVTELLEILKVYKEQYFDNGIIPELKNQFEVNLFNTFRSYIDELYFPRFVNKNSDDRGYLIEIVKGNTGGQTFFSSTKPGITRGNHFHTRKVERFCVINGTGMIKLRNIGENKIREYKVSGDKPSFIDMPVWCTHSITNIGNDELLTLFWTNEIFNPDDADTYFEKV